MMTPTTRGSSCRRVLLTLAVCLTLAGCQRQPKSENGKTYTADKGAGGQGQQTGAAQQSGSANGSAHGQPNGGKPQGGATGGTNGASGGAGAQGGNVQTGGQSGSNESDAKPLNAPADTTNGKPSRASDNGNSQATHDQVVSQPGAPPEHKPH